MPAQRTAEKVDISSTCDYVPTIVFHVPGKRKLAFMSTNTRSWVSRFTFRWRNYERSKKWIGSINLREFDISTTGFMLNFINYNESFRKSLMDWNFNVPYNRGNPNIIRYLHNIILIKHSSQIVIMFLWSI